MPHLSAIRLENVFSQGKTVLIALFDAGDGGIVCFGGIPFNFESLIVIKNQGAFDAGCCAGIESKLSHPGKTEAGIGRDVSKDNWKVSEWTTATKGPREKKPHWTFSHGGAAGASVTNRKKQRKVCNNFYSHYLRTSKAVILKVMGGKSKEREKEKEEVADLETGLTQVLKTPMVKQAVHGAPEGSLFRRIRLVQVLTYLLSLKP